MHVVIQGQRKLNDTYTGGIGSYLLCSMITSFLQQVLYVLEAQHNTGSM